MSVALMPADKINSATELTARASNVLRMNNLNTFDEIASLDARTLLSMRNTGVKTIKELARVLLLRFITPKWLVELAPRFDYEDEATIVEEPFAEDRLEKEGWRRISGPYTRQEQWMLEHAVADMVRGGIEYKLVRSRPNGPIDLYRKGAIEIPEEDV